MMVGLVIALALPLGLIGIIVALRWSSRPPVAQPSCARCGYDVSRAPASRCAECGGDLHLVGVITREMGRTPIAARRAVVNAIMLIVVMVITGLYTTWATNFTMRKTHIMVQRVTVDQPLSGKYRSFAWSGERRERSGRVWFGPHCLRIEFDDGRLSRPFCVHPAPLEPTFSSLEAREIFSTRAIISDQDILSDRLHAWAQREGLDSADPGIASELEEMRWVAMTSFRDTGAMGGPAVPSFTGTPNLQILPGPSRTWIAVLAGFGTGLLFCLPGLLFWWWGHHAFRKRCRRAALRLNGG